MFSMKSKDRFVPGEKMYVNQIETQDVFPFNAAKMAMACP